jgi:cation diffusion facilitator family transporter
MTSYSIITLMAAGGSKKVILISLGANFTVALAKLFGSFYTGSSALMSESIHSFSDCCNQLLLLFGGHMAKKELSEKYPLGRDREIFFWSFMVAFLLFTMGGIFSLYEGIHKIQDPHPLNYPWVAIAILIYGIVVEAYSFLACYKEVKLVNHYKSLWTWVRKTHAADLLVIFLEDFAAVMGLIFALISTIIAWVTGDGIWDGIGSCFIGVLLIVVALILAIELKQMLVGEAAGDNYQELLEPILEEHLPGAKFLRMIAIQRGVNAVLLAYKIHPGETNDLKTTINKLNQFEKRAKINYPEIKWQFAELDIES